MTEGVKHFRVRNRDEQETVLGYVRTGEGAPELEDTPPEPRAERTRWQMSLTVDERRCLDRRSRELCLTRSGYVKLLMREDRARAEREEGRS